MPFDDVENKVERGSKLRIKASTFNEIQDVVKAFKRREFELKGQKPTSLIRSNLEVLVYNSIGSDLTLPFQVVKLKQPLLDISEDVLNANTRSTFISVTPGSTFDPIAITQVPIQDGEIDRAVINGVTIVKVKFTAVDHSWANPVNGETDFLESAELGQARILMDLGPASGGLTESGDELDSGEESGSGSGLIDDTRWCMVNLIGSIFAEDESGNNDAQIGRISAIDGSGNVTIIPQKLVSGVLTDDSSYVASVMKPAYTSTRTPIVNDRVPIFLNPNSSPEQWIFAPLWEGSAVSAPKFYYIATVGSAGSGTGWSYYELLINGSGTYTIGTLTSGVEVVAIGSNNSESSRNLRTKLRTETVGIGQVQNGKLLFLPLQYAYSDGTTGWPGLLKDDTQAIPGLKIFKPGIDGSHGIEAGQIYVGSPTTRPANTAPFCVGGDTGVINVNAEIAGGIAATSNDGLEGPCVIAVGSYGGSDGGSGGVTLCGFLNANGTGSSGTQGGPGIEFYAGGWGSGRTGRLYQRSDDSRFVLSGPLFVGIPELGPSAIEGHNIKSSGVFQHGSEDGVTEDITIGSFIYHFSGGIYVGKDPVP
jgi:hypothetical protein